jgi:hypothetical protein
MTGIDFMLISLGFTFVVLAGLLALSEFVMWLEDRAYEDAENGGDWMDI